MKPCWKLRAVPVTQLELATMPKIPQSENESLTFHLSDAAQRVLEGAQGGGLITVPLLRGEVKLQLLQNLDHLLLGLGFGRLFTAARGTAPSQMLHHGIFLEDARSDPPNGRPVRGRGRRRRKAEISA